MLVAATCLILNCAWYSCHLLWNTNWKECWSIRVVILTITSFSQTSLSYKLAQIAYLLKQSRSSLFKMIFNRDYLVLLHTDQSILMFVFFQSNPKTLFILCRAWQIKKMMCLLHWLNKQHYACPRCGYNTRRNRKKWLSHYKQCDSREYDDILKSVRAVNNVVQ